MTENQYDLSAVRFSFDRTTQADVRKNFGGVKGQKLWYLCLFDKKYPELNIVDRILTGSLDFSKIKSFQLPRLKDSDRATVEEFFK